MSKHIFWLASYPKSGNTLFRSIISSLFFSIDGKFDFELLRKIVSFEEIGRLRKINGMEPDKFLNKDRNKKNNLIYDNLFALQDKSNLGFVEDFAFFKTHFCNKFEDKNFLIKNNVRGIIYIIRDPRDICVSWANHANMSIKKSVDFLLDSNSFIQWTGKKNNELYPKNIPVHLSDWGSHVTSWKNQISYYPHLIIRYEDLVYNKENILINLLNFFEKNFKIQITNKDAKIKNIIKTTNFDNLQKEEKVLGFKEASKGRQFFAVGKKDQWKNKLDVEDIKKIQNKFGPIMEKYNYKLKVEF